MTTSAHPDAAVRCLTRDDMPRLAAALGDSPETVISHHMLTTGSCTAWCVGDIAAPTAAVVQADIMPAEPAAFGRSAEDIARIVPHVTDWSRFLVPWHLAHALERPIATAADTLSISTLEDIYHVLEGPVAGIERRPEVRLLTADDQDLLGEDHTLSTHDDREMIIAAAFVDGDVISLAHTFAWSPGHVDIAVSTHEEWRRQGYATTAAALVTEEILKRGRRPVWSCGAHNVPSLSIAARLGFREMSRKVYIVPQTRRP